MPNSGRGDSPSSDSSSHPSSGRGNDPYGGSPGGDTGNGRSSGSRRAGRGRTWRFGGRRDMPWGNVRAGRSGAISVSEFRDLRVSGVTRSFSGTPALRGIDLDVSSGGTIALLGPSGCGKTTLMRIVAGLETADTGEVRLGGHLLSGDGVHVGPEYRRIGLLSQERSLFPHLSVAGNVGYGLPRSPERAKRIAEVLELVDLGGYQKRMPHTLSGGQQQRVALARALAPRPLVLLLDEPFQGLDLNLRLDLQREVRSLLGDLGATAVIVTHDQDEAFVLGDEVAVMAGGQICQLGTPDEVYDRPLTPWVASFVGDVNFLAGTGAGDVATTALGRLALRERCQGAVSVLVRPSHVRIRAAPGEAGGREPAGSQPLNSETAGGNHAGVPARVEQLFSLGHVTECHARLGGEVLLVRSGRMPRLQVGQDVLLAYDGPPTMAYPADSMAETAATAAVADAEGAAGGAGAGEVAAAKVGAGRAGAAAMGPGTEARTLAGAADNGSGRRESRGDGHTGR